ncbi:MAG: hypothetical protein RLZZ70_332 [Candidatus Parcubacteria bacterium]|jgi:hypothetical protein
MKIKTQDKITLFSALLVGVITGSYLYLVGFAPEFESSNIPLEGESSDFVLIGEKYSADESSVPASFQVRDDGSYRYLPESPNPEAPLPAVEGKLSRAQLSDIQSMLDASALAAVESSTIADACSAPNTTGSYLYFVTVDGIEYQLDSCIDDFSVVAGLETVLLDVWNVVAGGSE